MLLIVLPFASVPLTFELFLQENGSIVGALRFRRCSHEEEREEGEKKKAKRGREGKAEQKAKRKKSRKKS